MENTVLPCHVTLQVCSPTSAAVPHLTSTGMLWGGTEGFCALVTLFCGASFLIQGISATSTRVIFPVLLAFGCSSIIDVLQLALLGSEVLFCKQEELALCSKYIQSDESFLNKLN